MHRGAVFGRVSLGGSDDYALTYQMPTLRSSYMTHVR